MKNPFENLLEKDFHIVEKRKIIFTIPIAIFVIAAIMMIIFNFTLGSPLNLGTDFTGGYSIDVNLGEKLTESNYDEYCTSIRGLLDEVKTEDGNTYSIRIDSFQKQGSDATAAIHVKYFQDKNASESQMLDQVNPAIKTKLEENMLNIIPTVSVGTGSISVVYGEALNNVAFELRKDAFVEVAAKYGEDYGLTFEDGAAADNIFHDSEANKILITYKTVTDGDAFAAELKKDLSIVDTYSGSVTTGALVGATVSTELIFNAVLAVALALVFMLCYIGLRFQLSSGLACIIALLHDILVMFAFMAICRVPINSTFIAALITILGYSINNSIIVFDRVRENKASVLNQNLSPEDIANKSVRETLMRSINTTITTLIMIVMVAIIGVDNIRIFAFPIIIGLISGTFSSICIAPSFWALFQRVGKKNKSNFSADSKKKSRTEAKEPVETQA